MIKLLKYGRRCKQLINKTLKENWLKILKFNAGRDNLENSHVVEEKVRIPLSPIRINIDVLYNLFEIFYPKFVNDQQNILDIVVSEVEKKEKVLGLYLYETKKVGIHENIKKIPNNLLKSKDVDLERLDNFFNKLQTKLMKEIGIRISSIRIFKKEAIDLINKHCENIRNISLYDFLTRILDLSQIILKKNLFLIYPEPLFLDFLKGIIELLGNIQIKEVFSFIETLLPKFRISFLIGSDELTMIFLLQKKVLKYGKTELILKIFTPSEINVDLTDFEMKDKLNSIKEKLNVEGSYYLHLQDLIFLISNVSELLVPLKVDNLELLLQKLLFGFRSFEKLWNVTPRPIIYNNIIRFIVRLFGFNNNLRKLSHWAIPRLIFNFINFYFGLNSRVLLLITDINKRKKLKINQTSYLKSITKHLFLFEFENSTLIKIQAVDKDEVFQDDYSSSLDSIKIKSSEKFGFISHIIKLDKFLLQSIIENVIVNHSRLAPLLKIRTLRMMRKQKYFTLYPEIPPYQLIKKKGVISLLRLILPILIDKHEF